MSKARNLILRNFTMGADAPQPNAPSGAINARVGNAANMVRSGKWERQQALDFLATKLKPESMAYATTLLDKHIASMRSGSEGDPHALAAAQGGGKLIGIAFDKGQFHRDVAKMTSYAPGCGAQTPVVGTGGTIPCGAKLDGTPYFCPNCPT